MSFFRRSMLALVMALILPSLIFGGATIYFSLQNERREIETATLARAREVMDLIDSRLSGDLVAAQLLAASPFIDTADWPAFYERARGAVEISPAWATVILSDAQTGREILDLRRPLQAPIEPRAGTSVEAPKAPVIGGVVREAGMAYVPLDIPVLRQGAVRYRLTIAIRLDAYQKILKSHLPPGGVGGVVDRSGRFVARSLRETELIGTPATEYVRKAISTGQSGFYRGTTIEGFENYTAYYTSPLSGWSTHLAVASSLIDSPRTLSFLVATLAAFGSVALAIVLILLIVRDMNERRRQEDMLRQAQKMEAIGQLTGGIAHDFNNLLTAIVGGLELVSRRTQEERVRRPAATALEAANRAAKLTQGLLTFSRRQRMTLSTVDLAQLVNGMRELLSNVTGQSITLAVDIHPRAKLVRTDANQLELAILNLAVNARDAMDQGGTLTIRTRPAARRRAPGLESGQFVEFAVSDTGCGMSEEVRARALEPFYTTKPIGRGTGLGLSQVFGIVRQSGGEVAIDSKPGEGTTVRLFLPRGQPQSTARKARPAPAAPLPAADAGPPVVLVVDDDEQVLPVMLENIETLGYQLLSATNGEDALRILDVTDVDLLISDFTMPGMNGAELAKRARDKHPALRILFVTGFAGSAIEEALAEAALGETPVLFKPFSADDLAKAVAQVLKSEAAVVPTA